MKNVKRVDLHVHTTASDGTYSPADIIKIASQNSIIALAITDHDTIDGVKEAKEMGKVLGVEVISGIEVSTNHSLCSGEMHILGYFINENDQNLLSKIEDLKKDRISRNEKMIEKFKELGMDISLAEVEQIAGGDITARPHFAKALFNKGYVTDVGEAFEKYIGRDKPAYVKRDKVKPKEAIEMITASGGIAVLAHPKYLDIDKSKLEDVIIELKGYGLTGIEVYYSRNERNETYFFKKLCDRLGLIKTGGSDFHGDNRSDIKLGLGLGNLNLTYNIIEDLKKSLEK